MLILRTDAIGDYILFRNFFKYIKESEKYRYYSITLCGNKLLKEFAETFDKDYFHNFIWIDKSKFLKRSGWFHTISAIKRIHSYGFEILLDPTDNKSRISEYIKKHSGAGVIIENDQAHQKYFPEIQEDISTSESRGKRIPLNEFFQFNVNKRFAEKTIGTSIELTRTSLDVMPAMESEDYIILFPGAGTSDRMWSSEKFSGLCVLLRNITESKILICGDSRDRTTANEIVKFSGIKNIEDLTGKTTLPQLANLIGNAKLLISNESCAVHIAAAVGTKAVCISNGNHFGKFNPYPKSIAENIETLYPSQVSDHIYEYEVLIKQFAVSSDIDINEISSESVFEVARNLMR